MVGVRAGVSTLLRNDIPWLVNIHCVAHSLELAAKDAIKEHAMMHKVSDMLKGLYKQYHYSPKAWRELKDVREVGDESLEAYQATRWLPHMDKALTTLLKNYEPLVAHLEHVVEDRGASADMVGRARNLLGLFHHHYQLLFIHQVCDVLDVLGVLSSKFQEDGLTLSAAVQAFETAVLRLISFRTTPGEHLESYLESSSEGTFKTV